MEAKIAVLTDGDGRVCSAQEARTALVYARGANGWVVERGIAVPHSGESMAHIRDDMRRLIDGMDDSRVVAARGLAGVAYGVFDRLGFHIFDVQGVDGHAFDAMLLDIVEADEGERIRREIVERAGPVETSVPGFYHLDLILLQKECPEISSKRALRGFLAQTPFVELDLICSHAPPWLYETGLSIASEMRPDGNVRLTIGHPASQDCAKEGLA